MNDNGLGTSRRRRGGGKEKKGRRQNREERETKTIEGVKEDDRWGHRGIEGEIVPGGIRPEAWG